MILQFELIAALLPPVLLWLYIWRKDPQPEPWRWLLLAALGGVVICIPVSLVELGISTLFFGPEGEPTSLAGTTTMAFLVAALPEEAFKLLVLWLVLRKNPFFDEHFDGIVYAVSVGLGFAAIENVFYILSEDQWVTVAVTRALLAVPGHYAFAVLMGYFYSVYHFVDRSPKVAFCIFFVPFMLHGFYDALAMSGLANPYVGVISFFVLIFFCIRMHKIARTKILAQIKRDDVVEMKA